MVRASGANGQMAEHGALAAVLKAAPFLQVAGAPPRSDPLVAPRLRAARRARVHPARRPRN
jgi:hypothetical protein